MSKLALLGILFFSTLTSGASNMLTGSEIYKFGLIDSTETEQSVLIDATSVVDDDIEPDWDSTGTCVSCYSDCTGG